jgi:hypothetical protein
VSTQSNNSSMSRTHTHVLQAALMILRIWCPRVLVHRHGQEARRTSAPGAPLGSRLCVRTAFVCAPVPVPHHRQRAGARARARGAHHLRTMHTVTQHAPQTAIATARRLLRAPRHPPYPPQTLKRQSSRLTPRDRRCPARAPAPVPRHRDVFNLAPASVPTAVQACGGSKRGEKRRQQSVSVNEWPHVPQSYLPMKKETQSATASSCIAVSGSHASASDSSSKMFLASSRVASRPAKIP